MKIRGQHVFLWIFVMVMTVAGSCSNSQTESGPKLDTTEPEGPPVLPREISTDTTLPDTFARHFESIRRDFAHIDELRKENDKLLDMRMSEEERISREPVNERSEGHRIKATETEYLYELQKLDDTARPKMLKIENEMKGFRVMSSKAETARLIKEIRAIRERQLDIAYELDDDRLIREFRHDLEELDEAEMELL